MSVSWRCARCVFVCMTVGRPKMPGIMVGMDQYDNYVGDEARSQVSTVRPEHDDKLLIQT